MSTTRSVCLCVNVWWAWPLRVWGLGVGSKKGISSPHSLLSLSNSRETPPVTIEAITLYLLSHCQL